MHEAFYRSGNLDPGLSLQVPLTITDDTTETELVPAGGAGVYRDLLMLDISNRSASQVTITLRPKLGGTGYNYSIGPNGGVVRPWPDGQVFHQAEPDEAWTVQLDTDPATVDFVAKVKERR